MPSAIGLVMAVQPPDVAHSSAISTSIAFLWNVFIAYSFGGAAVIVVIRARGGAGTTSGSLWRGVTLKPVILAFVGSSGAGSDSRTCKILIFAFVGSSGAGSDSRACKILTFAGSC